MTIGSGIGGGWVCDGRLDEGQGLGAAEIGHTWVASPDGGFEKLENLCSGWSIGRRATALLARNPGTGSLLAKAAGRTGGAVTARDVSEAAEAGDALATSVMEEVTDALGAALGNVVALLNPERIVIGGGVSLMGGCLWTPLRRKVAQRGFAPFGANYDIVPAELGESVVVRGALSLAWILHAGDAP
jgi:glucokinase